MFRVTDSSGKVIAYVDKPNYISQSSNGSFVNASYEEALGVSVKSTPYHIIGRDNFINVDTKEQLDIAEVTVELVDGGEVTFDTESNVSDLSEQVTTLQEWVVEKELMGDLEGLEGLEDLDI